MKSVFKNILLLILLINGLQTSAQNETELIKLEYITSGASNFSNSPSPTMDQISSANSIFRATLNYGQDIRSESLQAIYSLSYSRITQQLDLSGVTDDIALESIPNNYYSYPNFSQVSLSSGLLYKFRQKWSATFLGALNFTDDFSSSMLKPNFTWLSIAYLEKKQSKNFSYGFGVFINQLENKLILTPSVSLKVKNSKRGFELLFPDKIRVWQKIKEKDFIEVFIKAQSLSLEYPTENVVKGLDIYTIKAGLGYNLIWQDFIKLNVGIDFPLILNSVYSTTNNFEFLQTNSIGFNLGLSIILPNE